LANKEKALLLFNRWLQSDTTYGVGEQEMKRIESALVDPSSHPALQYYSDAKELAVRQISLKRQELLPDTSASVFRATNNAGGSESFSRLRVGVSLLLLYGTLRAMIYTANIV